EIIGVAIVVILTDLDKRHAGLDKLTSQQAGLAEVGVAVAITVFRPLLADVEGGLRPQQSPRPLFRQAVAGERLGLVLPAVFVTHEPEQIRTTLIGGRIDVGAGEVRQPAGAIEAKRLVLWAEIAGSAVAGRAHADEARQVGPGLAEVLGDHRTDLG